MPMERKRLSEHFAWSAVSGKHKAHAAKWITDWMRIFPGVRPRWMLKSDKFNDDMNLLRITGTIRKAPPGHKWGPAREAVKDESRYHTDYIPRDVPQGNESEWKDDEEDLRAPPPGKLFKMYQEMLKHFKVHYWGTITAEQPEIVFKSITGTLAVRMAGAHEYIAAGLFYGHASRSFYGGYTSNAVAAYVADRNQTGLQFMFPTASSIRKQLASVLSKGKKEYILLELIELPQEMWQPRYGPARVKPGTPGSSTFVPDSANYYALASEGSDFTYMLTSRQVFSVMSPGVWAAYRHVQLSSGKALLVLVAGVFLVFRSNGEITMGEVLKTEDGKLVKPLGDKLWEWGINAYEPATRTQFFPLIGLALGEMHRDQAREWGMLGPERFDSAGELINSESHVPGMDEDEIVEKLAENMHERALDMFGLRELVE